MPAWDELLNELATKADDQKAVWLDAELSKALEMVSQLRDDRNVLFYGSAFLQKPTVPGYALSIQPEDLNGLMSVFYGMDWNKGLTLILHTPGGATNATETIVHYVRSKFPDDFEVIVPTFAMSAGTMISLASDRVWMGRQSQLGPIDPQMMLPTGQASAMSIVEQFGQAKADVSADKTLAHVWAPILQSLGPSLLKDAENALAYSETMVSRWLEQWMLSGEDDPAKAAKAVAAYFNNANVHLSHGRRIDRDEARSQGLTIENLETSQPLQEAVLTAYHLFTIMVQHGPAVKVLRTSNGRMYIKNHGGP